MQGTDFDIKILLLGRPLFQIQGRPLVFYVKFKQIMIRAILYLKFIYFSWADISYISSFMYKLIKINIFIIKNLF